MIISKYAIVLMFFHTILLLIYTKLKCINVLYIYVEININVNQD